MGAGPQLCHTPEEIIQQYKLRELNFINDRGFIYVAINGSMYGLSPADCMANIRLVPYLVQHGYHQSKRIPVLFKHETRTIAFILIVVDFGVKAIYVDEGTVCTDGMLPKEPYTPSRFIWLQC